MNKSLKLIFIIFLLSLASWLGFKYGQYRQVIFHSLSEQSQLIAAARLDVKALKLLNDKETDRLRNILNANIKSNIAFIGTWKQLQANSSWWAVDYPAQAPISSMESIIKESVEKNMLLLESEYNEVR